MYYLLNYVLSKASIDKKTKKYGTDQEEMAGSGEATTAQCKMCRCGLKVKLQIIGDGDTYYIMVTNKLFTDFKSN